MSKPAKGLRVGNYRITPLGLVTLAVLILLIAAAIVFFVWKPVDFSTLSIGRAPEPTPTEEPLETTAEPVAEVTAEPTAVPQARKATIRALGEIAMQQNLLRSAVKGNNFNFKDMFSEISSQMADADYTIADVEGTLGDTTDYAGRNKKMITPSSLIDVLKKCGVDMLTIANDHALDGGAKELRATMKNLTAKGMAYVGGATSAKARKKAVVKTINGIKVGFIAYTETLLNAPKNRNSAVYKYGINLIAASNASADIKAAKKAGAKVIICCVSWGKMMSRTPTANQKKIAQYLAKAGVDVIIGYNPHTVQPASWIETTNSKGTVRRTLCLGATGNFLSDQRKKYFDSGIIFQFTIKETGPNTGKYTITAPRYIPTYVWRKKAANGKYTYKVLPVGLWLQSQPSGMAYSDVTRMRQVWSEIQKTMGKGVASISAE